MKGLVTTMAISERITIPRFDSGEEEACWRDANKSMVEENLLDAMRDGTARRRMPIHNPD